MAAEDGAAEDGAEAPRPESGRDLPAPYQDPYGALGRDLQAVVATLRLRAQELWRRNRQGDLSVPGFWPQDLAPLFWPVLLALALAALLALTLALGRLLTTPLPAAAPTAEAWSLAGAPPEPAPSPPDPPLVLEPGPQEPQQPQETQELQLELDPLIQLLSEGDPRQLIASVYPDPAAGLLTLELTAGFGLLPASERRSQADQWLERSERLGYDHLQLVDPAGRAVGRQALVGSGMILLDFSP